jgi:hypothetical protein
MNTDIVSLGDLARQINESEKRISGLKTEAVEEAVKQGNLLHRAKAQLPHGKFTPRVEANCTVSPRQARTYMTLAAGVAGLPEPERKAILGGGIEAAVKTLKTKSAATPVLPEQKASVSAPDTTTKAATVSPTPEPPPEVPAFDLASVSDDDLLAEVQRRLEADVVAMATRVSEGEKINYQGIPKKDVALLKRFKRDYPRFYDVSAAAWGLVIAAVARERTEERHGETLKRIA